jgi:hypothetical protein
MKRKKFSAISTNQALKLGFDMSTREKEILVDIVAKTSFIPKENIWKSSYWGKNLGASIWLGIYKGKLAVLKIQGTKPNVSEAFMIKNFSAQNRSRVIGPPALLKVIPWSEDKKYEALLMKHASGEKVLRSKKIQTEKNICVFFELYQEYRKNCLPKEPWLSRPTVGKLYWEKVLEKLADVSQEAFPDHPLRQLSDIDLATHAMRILAKTYKNVSLEFLHGHFSVEDLVYESNKSGRVILFSNLFWKWKYPYYDAVFGYHWFMYELSHVKGITSNQVEDQRKLWQKALVNLPSVKNNSKNKRLLDAALLERAVAGLVVDSLLVDRGKPIAGYLVNSTRKEVERLCVRLL